MNQVCYICGKNNQSDEELIQIKGKMDKFVCSADLDKHLDFQKESAIQDNEICKICLINQPTCISIKEIPFQKYCNTCACFMFNTTSGGPKEKFFIPIEWKDIIRNEASLEKYTKIRLRIKSVKDQCKKFKVSFENSVKNIQLTKFVPEMIPSIENYFGQKIKEAEAYREKYISSYKQIIKVIKNSILSGNSEINPVVSKFLKNQHVFDAMDSSSLVKAKLNLDLETIKEEPFYEIYFKPLNEMIDLEFLYIFCDDKPDVFEYSPVAEGVHIKRVAQAPFLCWKANAFWASFDSGDTLYTGGLYNRKPSDICFLVDPRKDLHNHLPKITPRQGHTITTFNSIAFVFGGDTLISEKFIHKQNIWERIADTPEKLTKSTSTLFYEEIMVTGANTNKLYYYNIKRGCFTKEFMNVDTGNKLLLRIHGNIFLLVGSFVLGYDQEKKVFVKEIADNDGKHNNSVMEPRVLKNKVYWVTVDGKVCSFDITSNRTKIEKLKSDFNI